MSARVTRLESGLRVVTHQMEQLESAAETLELLGMRVIERM